MALVITPLAVLGCGSTSDTTPAPLPEPDSGAAVEPNDSLIFCQIALFLAWDGPYPREMRVAVRDSTEVEGLVNYTKDKIGDEIDVIWKRTLTG